MDEPGDLLALALVLTIGGVGCIAGYGVTAGERLPPIEPIPVVAAAVATPVPFPTIPPTRATPMFVSTENTPIPFSPWHEATLMRWYLPEPDDYPGMHES